MKSASIGLRVASRRRASIEAREYGTRNESGFTLLETLVALSILAVVFASLFDAHAIALRNVRVADDYTRARVLGQSLLADAVTGWSHPPLPNAGVSGRFHWSINVAEERAPWAVFKTKKNWRLYRVNVDVSWDRNRHVVLNTLKLGLGP